jgi:hypothetical protein
MPPIAGSTATAPGVACAGTTLLSIPKYAPIGRAARRPRSGDRCVQYLVPSTGNAERLALTSDGQADPPTPAALDARNVTLH